MLIVLTTTGWATAQPGRAAPGPRTVELNAWRSARAGGRPLPDPMASPERIARFFTALSGPQQRRLADRYPLVVGALEGAPLRVRLHANRVALREARDRERSRATDPRLTEAGRYEANRREHRFSSLLRDGRQILVFDPTGPGRAVEVFGDLRRAERVSVVVPGVGTELLTFERTRRAHSAPVGMARALFERQRAVAPHLRTAVVAWAGYAAPRGLTMEAVTGELAEHGAQRLVSFVRALPGGASVALFCHSYGSVVCAAAADDGAARITDIAVAGSPGIRVDRAEELNTTARVWAMRTADDWISGIPHLKLGDLGHGSDPMSPAFGARRLATDGAVGHGGYFEPGTGSLANLADIGVGSFATVRCAASDPGCASSFDRRLPPHA